MVAGIALIPSPSFVDSVVSMQARLREQMTIRPLLSATGNLPHVSLVQNLNLEDDAIYEKLRIIRRRISETPSGVSFRVLRASYVERGWCFLDLFPDPFLLSLHLKTFALTKPMLRSPKTADPDRLANYSAPERDNFLRFGYRYIGDSYRPHVTVGRISTRNEARALALIRDCLGRDEFIGDHRMNRLTLYEVGRDGAHSRCLVSYAI